MHLAFFPSKSSSLPSSLVVVVRGAKERSTTLLAELFSTERRSPKAGKFKKKTDPGKVEHINAMVSKEKRQHIPRLAVSI